MPLISEEYELAPFVERQQWQRYWLVDPLDGTREFVKRNNEFSVNIALIDHGRPVLGVVHAPALGLSYYTDGQAACKELVGQAAQRIHARALDLGRISVSEPHIVHRAAHSRHACWPKGRLMSTCAWA